MKIEYDPEAKAAYICLKPIEKGGVKYSKELEDNIIVDFDKDNHIVGIELLNVSKPIVTKRDKKEEIVDDKLTLNIEETAKMLGIGRNLCYDRAKAGEIPVIKIGSRLIVPRAALMKMLAEPEPFKPVQTEK